MRNIWMGFICVLNVNIANAACKLVQGSSSTFTTTVNIDAGIINVSPTAAVGTILKRIEKRGTRRGTHLVSCVSRDDHSTLTYEKPQTKTKYNKVFETNIPGIGLRISMKSIWNGVAPHKHLHGSSALRQPPVTYIFEVIKIGEVQSGVFDSGRYSKLYYSGMQNLPHYVVNFSGKVNVIQPTCAWTGNPNRTIHLNPVSRGDFKGVGTVVGEKEFNLDLNCAVGNAGKVGIGFDFISNANNNSVILNTANSQLKAQGVDLQLASNYQDKRELISKGLKLALGNVDKNKASNFIVPIRARYIQSDAKVTAGEVNGSVTVTIRYN